MNQFIRALGTFFRILFVGGERFIPARTVDSRNGIVYVYRPKSRSVISPGVRIDEREYAVLPEGGYMYFELAPGSHVIELSLSERWHGRAAVPYGVESAGTTYLRVENYITGGGTPEHRFEVKPVTTAVAEAEIRKCRLRERDVEKFKKSGWVND